MQPKKLALKERYQLMTRGLGWETSYQPMDKVFPYDRYEGIKITDWDKWQDPFRLTMDAYWKYQSEKERKLYAILDSFAQNNGFLNLSDARYINSIKLFAQAVNPLEHSVFRLFSFMGRHFRGEGTRIACQMQAIDELRHYQTQRHSFSTYNKYFDGFSDNLHQFDHMWYLSVPKSFAEDAATAGPFEFVLSICFAFEYVLTNLLFVPFMSGAAYNGDTSSVTFGFSAQSDEARHMTLGLEVIKFMLEQHEDNVPIVQRWIDKWFWRGYRLLSLVSMMMDYMLPKKVMSWAEAWELYFEQNGGALFNDLARYGIRPPKYAEQTLLDKHHLSHQLWATFYQTAHATAFHSWLPTDEDRAWLSEKYPTTFDSLYAPRFDHLAERHARGERFTVKGLPELCQTCQIPLVFTEPTDPTRISLRHSTYKGEHYNFCSDGCKDIFDFEPGKYVRAWLPVHQIYQGNCGEPGLEGLLDYYHMTNGVENGEYYGSPEEKRWRAWKGLDASGDERAAGGA